MFSLELNVWKITAPWMSARRAGVAEAEEKMAAV